MGLNQTCQTQTNFWAFKATKTAEEATKVPKNPSARHIKQNLEVENDFIMLNKIFST